MAEIQLSQSIKKWNKENNLDQWNYWYNLNNYHGNRLRAREKMVLEYLDSLKLPKKSVILELGYGAGVTSKKICEREFKLIGVDVSETLRKIAIKNCNEIKGKPKFEFMIGNAEKLDLPDNSVDCVIGLGFLQYLEKPLSCFKEIARVLKPGGHCIIAQRNMFGISSLDGPLKILRSVYYLISNRKHELRWQDTPLWYAGFIYAKLASKHKLISQLIEHKKIGLVRKNAWSFSRLYKLHQISGLTIVGYVGAGYLSKKNKLAPGLFRNIDRFLQKASLKKTIPGIYKLGNSLVFISQVTKERI